MERTSSKREWWRAFIDSTNVGKQKMGSKKAKVFWALKEAKDKGIDFCDAGHAKKIQTRS